MNKKQQIFTFATLMAMAVACHKDPIPEPIPPIPEPTPDTITPVIPGDTITPVVPNDTISPVPNDTITPGDTIPHVPGKIANFYYEGGNDFPPLDSVRRYAIDPTYDSVYIYFGVASADRWTPIGFRVVCDSLKRRFDISPKVRGGWWITPYQILPDIDSTNIGVKGMIRSDSARCANWKYPIYPVVTNRREKSILHYDGNHVLRAGRSR